ncbi:MAG: DNA methyltransferase [Bacteroidales bacterium]|nr:DNA methyltransferase [Bacteroidales bacterium]
MPQSLVHNTDCIQFMQSLPDNFFSLAIADPPYGLDKKSTQGSGQLKNRTLNRHDMKWDVKPPRVFFDQLRRVSKQQIIWGGNYFDLGPARCFICWDKQQVWPNFSQCEYAWTSFDKPAKLVTISNRGGNIDFIDWHPTAKPVQLYAYILNTFALPGDSIFDPMMGSQSSRIAAYKLGFDYVGCELDEDYFNKGCERFDRECRGITHCNNGKTFIQTVLFST